MNNNIETFKLQHVALEFKVNEVKQTVTAIEKFIVPKFNFKFTTVGVSSLKYSYVVNSSFILILMFNHY